MREKVVERFLKYVTFDTTANPNNSNCPSSEGQRVFANYLVEELKSLGLDDAHVDENSYVMATLKGKYRRCRNYRIYITFRYSSRYYR